jgi:hypothetical protein
LEGPQPFSAGDYLARNAKGEWPIKHETLAKNYIQVTPEDEEGFAGYRRLGFRLAAPMPEAFTIEDMHGKAGDYLVLGGGGGWPVDCEIFEQTYTLIEQEDEGAHMKEALLNALAHGDEQKWWWPGPLAHL